MNVSSLPPTMVGDSIWDDCNIVQIVDDCISVCWSVFQVSVWQQTLPGPETVVSTNMLQETKQRGGLTVEVW